MGEKVIADGQVGGAVMEEFEEEMMFNLFGSKQNHNQILTIMIVVGSIYIALLICMIVICHCNKERKQGKNMQIIICIIRRMMPDIGRFEKDRRSFIKTLF